MPVTYESWLVLLSIGMAIQGAYVGLSLAVQIGAATGTRRRLLLAGAAVSLAVGIWTMHFVGMLAVRVPFAVDYLVFPTLLSFLVCVIVVGAAVYATSSGPLTMLRLTLSSCLMGGGIFTMHYIGMTALSASAYMIHDRVYVAASMAIAIAASGLALWLATGRGGRPPRLRTGLVGGVAGSGMHYTAMAGLTLLPFVSAPAGAPALSPDLLAIVVSIVAFCLSGIFLLLLMPDASRATGHSAAAKSEDAAPEPATAMPGVAAAMPEPSATKTGNGADPEFGRGTYAPLGGAGAPPRRFARHLPIEREGSTHFIAVDDVVAIHANAHYTYIFNGSDKLFCPLAIGDVESRLDSARFVRIHRSHIVNIDRVVGYRRSGDNELVALQASHDYAVPVSRSRIGPLKTRVAALTGDDPAVVLRRRHHFAPQ
jgi:NO-binding membrane sensor protein with MHYT domain